MRLRSHHIKMFINTARADGFGMAVKKAISFILKRFGGRNAPALDVFKRAELQERLEQLKKTITTPECQGVFIMGSQCMGWNEVFKQRHHHIAEYLLENGYTVFCAMNPQYEKDVTATIKEERANLYLVNFDDRSVWKATIDFVALHAAKPIYYHLVGTEPGTTPNDIAYLKSLGAHLVYDYFDEVSTIIFPGLSEMSQKRHTQLLNDPDVLVVTTADKLYQDALRHKRENVILSTNGVCLEDWDVSDDAPVPPEMTDIVTAAKPVIGFYGSFAPWLDYGCIKKLALTRPGYTIVMIGYDYEWGGGAFAQSGIADLPNVRIIPAQPYDDLKFFSRHFSVGIVPFKEYGLSESVSPVKMFEYMAQKLPVVATGLPEARKYASVLNASGEDNFVATVDRALALAKDPAYMALLRKDAENNTWASRGAQVKRAMEAMVPAESAEPVLSVVIPTYNMVSLLPRCVDSLLQPSIMARLEIIIVNDGSQDASIAVAKWYAAKYPAIVSVIDKENGGHGSCVNVGIRAAKGRYFKLVDSDDWLDPVALVQHVRLLSETDADMVVTSYKQAFETGGTFSISYADRLEEKEYSRDELIDSVMKDTGPTSYVHMHAITYKTALLKENDITLTEKSFYVDQEYIAYPQEHVTKVVYEDVFLYRYLVGRPGQSVDAATARKRSPECYGILKKIIAFLERFPKDTALRGYLEMLAYHQAYFFLQHAKDDSRKQEIFTYFAENTPKFKTSLKALM